MAIIDVIKYEGGNNILVWKHPCKDFNTSAQLIVHQTQEAIVFKDGQASEPYTPGKHTIQTENIPGIRRIVGLTTGGVSPNHYDVYFINKTFCMNIFWGTTSPWELQDPTLQIPFYVRTYGKIIAKVNDSRVLMQSLIGTTTSLSNYCIEEYFRGMLTSEVEESISNTILDEEIGFATITAKRSFIASNVKRRLEPKLNKYGLHLDDFIIESIQRVPDEFSDRVRSAQTGRAIHIIEGMSKQEEEAINIAKLQASNPGMAGQMGGIFTGISAGAAMAPVMGNIVKGAMQPIANAPVGATQQAQKPDQFSMGATKRSRQKEEQIKCPNCGAEVPKDSRFCPQCGKPLEEVKPQCPNCGADVPAGSKFCNQCGKAL